MSETKLATKVDLKEMYDRILPYLGGSADAGFTPIGTVIPMIAETAPANYLICDGTAYNKSDYPELAKHLLSMTNHSMYEVSGDSTKFKVPDLRGEFMRMTGTNSHANQGNGAAVGVHQNATQMPTLYIWENGYQIGSYVGTNGNDGTEYFDKAIKQSTKGMSVNCNRSWDTVTTSVGTIRPTNTSFLFCIATKNIYLNPSNDYSTDEKVVGTWIDGKTIYQKTCTGTVTTYTDGGWENTRRTIIFNPTISNIKEVVNCFGFVKNIIGTGSGIPGQNMIIGGSRFYGMSGKTSVLMVLDGASGNSTSVTFYSNTAFGINSVDFVVTYQYTKTTD